MSQSLVSSYVHIVFSTRNRQKSIKDMPNTWAYLGGIAKRIGAPPIAIGGMTDHVHLLLEPSSRLAVDKIVNLLKSNSSRWIKKEVPAFAWQRGYGAFTVSASNVPVVKRYVLTQPEHHQRRSFEEEFVLLLKKHKVDYDPHYVFD
jgi:putative transposase